MKSLLIAIISSFFIVQAGFANEPFMLRSFDVWEDQVYELSPVFRHLRHQPRDWSKIGEVADILSLEASDDSLQSLIGRYFTLVAERATQTRLTKEDLPGKVDRLEVIQSSLREHQTSLPTAVYEDIQLSLQFETGCHRFLNFKNDFLSKKNDDVVRNIKKMIETHPSAPITPDVVKQFAEMMIDLKDYNHGLAFLVDIARDYKEYERLRFESLYQSSRLEARFFETSPKALWFCRKAEEATDNPHLVHRAQQRIQKLHKIKKQ